MNIKDQKFIDMITEIKAKIVRYHPDLEKEFDRMIFQMTNEDYTAAFFYIMRFLEWAIGIIYKDVCYAKPIICDEYECKNLMREKNKKQSKTAAKNRIYIETSKNKTKSRDSQPDTSDLLMSLFPKSKDSQPDTSCYSKFEHKNGRIRTLSLSEQLGDIGNSSEMSKEFLTGYTSYPETGLQGILDKNEEEYKAGKLSKESYLQMEKEYGERLHGKFSDKMISDNVLRIGELTRIKLEIVKSKILLDTNEKDYASGKILEQEYLKEKRAVSNSKRQLEQQAKEYVPDLKFAKEISEKYTKPLLDSVMESAKETMGPIKAKKLLMTPKQLQKSAFPKSIDELKTLEEVSEYQGKLDANQEHSRDLRLIHDMRTERLKKRLKKITYSKKVIQLLQYLRKKQRNVAFHQANSYVDHNEMINSVYVMDEIVDKFDVILMDDIIEKFLRRKKEANYSKGKTRLLSFDLPPSKKGS